MELNLKGVSHDIFDLNLTNMGPLIQRLKYLRMRFRFRRVRLRGVITTTEVEFSNFRIEYLGEIETELDILAYIFIRGPDAWVRIIRKLGRKSRDTLPLSQPGAALNPKCDIRECFQDTLTCYPYSHLSATI